MEYVIWYFRDMKLGHILGTRSIKTAGFSWDLQGISIEENAYKSSNIKVFWKFLTIAKTRARKLEIKCGDEPPWVRIPPSLPVKSMLPRIFPRELFCACFIGACLIYAQQKTPPKHYTSVGSICVLQL